MDVTTSKYILDSFKQYAIYVCETRSIPKVTDGLKSSQRKALWVAKGKREKIKTISLAGEMISRGLYVHGDSSASQAISLMAAPFCNNIPYFDGYGAFGTRVNPYGFGAPRYTYVKINSTAERLFFIDEEIIPMTENYDGSTIEPSTFIPLVPLVLLNGVSGIAVGWSTEILRHDIKDIINSTINVLSGEKIENLKPYYKDYDIDIIEDKNSLKYVFVGKIERVNSTTVKIKSLPPDLSLEKIKENLNNLISTNKIKDYEDVSTNNIEILVKMDRESLKKYSDDDLIEMFKLKTKKTERIVVIDFDGENIKQYESHYELIKNFVDWRLKFFYKRYELKIEQAKNKKEFLEILKKLHEKKFPAFCGKAKNKKDIIDFICKMFPEIEKSLIDKIINIPIYRWTLEEYEKIKLEIKELEEKIIEYNDLITDENKIKQKYIDELTELKKEIKI